jgi:hypothetical protein
MPNDAKKKKPSPYTMHMGIPHREKLRRMQGFCLANDIQVSSGCILRTLLEHIPEQSPEFLEKVRVMAVKEKEEKSEKFLESTSARIRSAKGAKGRTKRGKN